MPCYPCIFYIGVEDQEGLPDSIREKFKIFDYHNVSDEDLCRCPMLSMIDDQAMIALSLLDKL